jgi:pilus assembly protein CpaB
MKRIIPILLAAIAFIVVLAILRPSPSADVVVAARGLESGHVIEAADVTLERLPKDLIPTDAFSDPSEVIGKTLAMNRTAGDVILPVHLGEMVTLQPNERAIALSVVDSTGLAGLLREGDRVGVTATLFVQGGVEMGAFSKVVIENLRVLYLSPAFRASDPMAFQSTPDPLSDSAAASSRAREGAVVLAVPVEAQAVVYDLASLDPAATNETRSISALELLSALDASDNARITLYLMPQNADPFTTSGLWLPDLIVQITPTPTATPTGWVGGTQP